MGDKFVCYMTKLSRWIGILEITGQWVEDYTPLYYPDSDPYVIRFPVEPIVWLDKEYAVPIKEDHIWNALTFTRGQEKNSFTWTGIIRNSLRLLENNDGYLLEETLTKQAANPQIYPIDEHDYERLLSHKLRRADKLVSVSVPASTEDDTSKVEVRESTKIQALLANIGATMGMKIWLPRNDREAVKREWQSDLYPLVDVLPLNYDEVTLRTIEQIDVLWLKGRSIVRAFEVEHTTSIYSGILRMADLLALQPNMDIRLHIVAPDARREKVFQELTRPVFSLLEKGPLYESCTYLSYDSVNELAQEKHLAHLSDSVLDEYAEEAE